MDFILTQIKSVIYDKLGFEIAGYQLEQDSQEYDACSFSINGKAIRYRTAKITPKKQGLFVTFWKRDKNKPIEPFNELDPIDFFMVNAQSAQKFGLFIFPLKVLIQKGIISTKAKEGKRAFRVYPSWDSPQSKQAIRSQKWQLDYFYLVDNECKYDAIKSIF